MKAPEVQDDHETRCSRRRNKTPRKGRDVEGNRETSGRHYANYVEARILKLELREAQLQHNHLRTTGFKSETNSKQDAKNIGTRIEGPRTRQLFASQSLCGKQHNCETSSDIDGTRFVSERSGRQVTKNKSQRRRRQACKRSREQMQKCWNRRLSVGDKWETMRAKCENITQWETSGGKLGDKWQTGRQSFCNNTIQYRLARQGAKEARTRTANKTRRSAGMLLIHATIIVSVYAQRPSATSRRPPTWRTFANQRNN